MKVHEMWRWSVRVTIRSSLLCVFLLQDEEHHEQTSDVRAQLKFFEQLERLEKQRKDDEEREILLKVAKVGSAFHTRVQWKTDVRLFSHGH